MNPLKTEMDLKEISAKPEEAGNPPKTRFGIFGEEMIEKEVKPSGSTGRVYFASGLGGQTRQNHSRRLKKRRIVLKSTRINRFQINSMTFENTLFP